MMKLTKHLAAALFLGIVIGSGTVLWSTANGTVIHHPNTSQTPQNSTELIQAALESIPVDQREAMVQMAKYPGGLPVDFNNMNLSKIAELEYDSLDVSIAGNAQ